MSIRTLADKILGMFMEISNMQKMEVVNECTVLLTKKLMANEHKGSLFKGLFGHFLANLCNEQIGKQTLT